MIGNTVKLKGSNNKWRVIDKVLEKGDTYYVVMNVTENETFTTLPTNVEKVW